MDETAYEKALERKDKQIVDLEEERRMLLAMVMKKEKELGEHKTIITRLQLAFEKPSDKK